MSEMEKKSDQELFRSALHLVYNTGIDWKDLRQYIQNQMARP
jgi:hypothetical protein